MGDQTLPGKREALDQVGCLVRMLFQLLINYICLQAMHLRQMIDAAWEWAKARGLWRINPIHKEEEIKIVIEDFFKFSDEVGMETTQRGTMEMEDHKYDQVELARLHVPNDVMCPSIHLAICQDPEGALLDDEGLIPDRMSKLLPEVDDKAAGEGTVQPGTGASFKCMS